MTRPEPDGGERDPGRARSTDGPTEAGERRRPAQAQGRDRPERDRDGTPWRPRRHRREEPAGQVRPEPVGGAVQALLERLGIVEQVERARAVGEWDEIVGPRIAEATGDVRVDGDTLFVEVESASWMQELNMMRHEILRRLNAGREKGRVEKIVFLQGGRSRGRSGRSGRARHGKEDG